MKLNEAEMRMAYQIEATSQSAALNEIYMTWRYAPNRETKDLSLIHIWQSCMRTAFPRNHAPLRCSDCPSQKAPKPQCRFPPEFQSA